MRPVLAIVGFLLASVSQAQYVWPKPGYNDSEPGLYTEDPFIVHYRKEFFAVFGGNFARFEKAYKEIEDLTAKDPNDARALVWRGNGKMVKAGLALLTNKTEEAKQLLAGSDVDLDRAVALRSNDPNIYMMRAATLLLVHQRFPKEWVKRDLYDRLRDDSLKFINYIGPNRMSRVSIHLRGEAYASLAIAYEGLGLKSAATRTWKDLMAINPNTEYANKAQAELNRLGA